MKPSTSQKCKMLNKCFSTFLRYPKTILPEERFLYNVCIVNTIFVQMSTLVCLIIKIVILEIFTLETKTCIPEFDDQG